MRIGTTAQFVGGEKLPYDREVECIYNTAQGPYLSFPVSWDEAEVDYMATSVNNNDVFGITQSKSPYLYIAIYNSTWITVNNSDFNIATTFANTRHTFRLKRSGEAYIDGVLKATQTTSATGRVLNVLSSRASGYKSVGRIYGVKAWYEGALVVNAIPVVAIFNGAEEGVMYDKVSKTLFRNVSSGSFTWAELSASLNGGGYKLIWLPRVYTASSRPSARFCARPLWKEAA